MPITIAEGWSSPPAAPAGDRLEFAKLDPRTRHAAEVFVREARHHLAFEEAWLFGSRARQDHEPESDVDIAFIVREKPADRLRAAIPLIELSVDLFGEVRQVVSPIVIGRQEWEAPETAPNPDLIYNIRHEGIRV